MPKPALPEDDLLDCLTRVFQDHGYDGASLSLISQATGLERSSLYHRFPGGKDQMAEAVVRRVGARFADDVLAPLQRSGPLQTRIRETGRRLAGFYQQGSVSCILDTLSLGGGNSALRAAVARTYNEWRDAFASAAREAGFPPAEARRRAEEAIMNIHGALVAARATGDGKLFARAIARLPDLLGGRL